MGLGGLEPPTSPLSGVRSSHLNYAPETCTSNGQHKTLGLVPGIRLVGNDLRAWHRSGGLRATGKQREYFEQCDGLCLNFGPNRTLTIATILVHESLSSAQTKEDPTDST